MKKVWWGRNKMPIWKRCQLGNICFPIYMCFSFKLCICQDTSIAQAYTAQNKENEHFSLVSLSPRTRSGPGAEWIRQGEECLSCPPKTALGQSHLTENSSSENRILRPRRKKNPDRIPPWKKNDHLYIYMYGSSTPNVTGVLNSAGIFGWHIPLLLLGVPNSLMVTLFPMVPVSILVSVFWGGTYRHYCCSESPTDL